MNTNPNVSAQLLTVKEIAQVLTVSPATVNKWMKHSKLPYLKLGKAVRFLEKDVLAWVEKQRQN